MAKKNATKKKPSPQKKVAKVIKAKVVKPPQKAAAKKAGKSLKPATQAAKPALKPEKVNAKIPAGKVKAKSIEPAVETKKVEAAKPALMTKKGKAAVAVDEVEEAQAPVKSQTIVSLIETDESADGPLKAEKVSKVKPVKIERGNLADEKAKWAELFKKYGKDKAIQYKMSEKFSPMIPVQHKVLGWGFVLTNENDRLEVLFETGIRMLISNYKS